MYSVSHNIYTYFFRELAKKSILLYMAYLFLETNTFPRFIIYTTNFTIILNLVNLPFMKTVLIYQSMDIRGYTS